LIFWVAAIFLLPVSYGRPPLALAGFLVRCCCEWPGDSVVPRKGKGHGLKIFQRFHFSSALKRMSVIAGYTPPGSTDVDYIVTVKGAPEVLKNMVSVLSTHFSGCRCHRRCHCYHLVLVNLFESVQINNHNPSPSHIYRGHQSSLICFFHLI